MTRWILVYVAVLVIAGGAYYASQRPPAASGPVELAGVSMIVHKSPTCGCCGDWIDIMREHGMEITTIDTDDIVSIKVEHGVPDTQYSCHTAEVDGYVVEGHVPAEAIAQLLTERPEIRGIALGGMPQGSPGMSGDKTAPFEVMAYSDEGMQLFGRY